MKHAKKLASLLLALVMVFAVATTAFAAGTNSITVTGAQANETYKIYKMLDLVVNNDKTAYSYTVNSDWVNFFTGEGAGAAYVNIDAQGYVTWKEGKDTADEMESFGKALPPMLRWMPWIARLPPKMATLPLATWNPATT